MDIISHGLWGGVILGREKRKIFLWSFVFSILPDLLSEGTMFSLIYFGASNMPSFEQGHPNITEFPLYAQNFYNVTHSLVIFAIVFVLIWLIRKKPFLPLIAWGIHILIDIPTHSLNLFPTPFLWPVSNFKFNGIAWDNLIILIPNVVLLLIFYGIWLYRKKNLNSN